MEYRTHKPHHEPLRSRIVAYGEITGEGGTSKTISPRPGTALVINLSGSYRIDGVPGPDVAVFGIRERSICLEVGPAWTHRIQVQFHPCGLSRFVRASAASFAGRVVPALELFPAGDVERLRCELSSTGTLPEKAAVLDRFFLEYFSPPTPAELAIQELAMQICDNPDIALGDLLHELPASLRQTERYFARLIGVSPRSFARIARFEQAKNRIVSNDGETLTDIGLGAGYYDQAHFGREFRRLASMTPGSYTTCPPAHPAQ